MDIEVRSNDISVIRVVNSELTLISAGEIRPSINGFSLTTNYMTHGIGSDLLHKWNSFSAREKGWERISVWAIGTVVDGVVMAGVVHGDVFPPESQVTKVDQDARAPAVPLELASVTTTET